MSLLSVHVLPVVMWQLSKACLISLVPPPPYHFGATRSIKITCHYRNVVVPRLSSPLHTSPLNLYSFFSSAIQIPKLPLDSLWYRCSLVCYAI